MPLLWNAAAAEAIESSEIDYMVDRMTAIQERPGNPMGVEIRAFGGATAFYSQKMPWPQFNTVKGISAREIDLLDDILQFYREREGRPQFEITPLKASGELFGALSGKGFCQSGFHASLAGLPHECGPREATAGVTVRPLDKHEFDLYAEIHCLGTGLSPDGKSFVAANNGVLFEREGWKFFIGHVGGEPAGVGVMYMKSGLASLTFAATLPAFRNKGVQKALIERRLHEAEKHQCRLVAGQASYASVSCRNMQRAGMQLAYTRATWTQR